MKNGGYIDGYVISNKCHYYQLFKKFQLGQGTLLQVSPSLVTRRKTHFHNLPCGASIILGNNGYIWISPTVNEETDNTGGYEQKLDVRLSF